MATQPTLPIVNEESLSTSDPMPVAQMSMGFPVGPQIQTSCHDQNINQKLITVTEDKAQICLDRHLRRIGKRRWVHPLSLLISLQLALATSEFNKLTWISSDLLKSIFMVAAMITTGWLIWEIMHAGRLRHMRDVIGDIFSELRGEEINVEQKIVLPWMQS